MATAVAGLTAESIAEANIGISNSHASTSQAMLTSSGSRVRRLGTMAMSSSPQALRPVLPMPMSMSMGGFRAARGGRVASTRSRPPQAVSDCRRQIAEGH